MVFGSKSPSPMPPLPTRRRPTSRQLLGRPDAAHRPTRFGPEGRRYDHDAVEGRHPLRVLPHRSGSAGFARLRIKHDDKMNSELATAARRTPVHAQAAQQAWTRVVDHVVDAGLILSTHLPTLKQVTARDPQTVDRTAGRC